MRVSAYPESFVRTILARLLFKREEVFKKIERLSGGERVKVAFAGIFVQDFNILIMDEPTNYLDVYSMEALEEVLCEYEGTMLFISHDRRFIEKVADFVIVLEDGKVKKLECGTGKYFNSGRCEVNDEQDSNQKNMKEKILLLENRLALINGRLCVLSQKDDREELKAEYMKLLQELKILRENVKAAF